MRLTYVLLAALLLVFLTQTATAEADQCPPNYLEIADRSKVSGDGELIPTFAYIQAKIGQLDPVEYTTSTAQYRLFDIRPMLIYQAQQQISTVFGPDTVVVHSGTVRAEIVFSWIKNNDTSQVFSAKVSGKSQKLAYAKQIYIQNSTSLGSKFLDAEDIQWNPYYEPWKLTNVIPDNITKEDAEVLLSIAVCSGQFCKENQKKALRNQLTEAVNKVFRQYLIATISSQYYQVPETFDFNLKENYRPTVRTNTTMSRSITEVYLQKDSSVEILMDVKALKDDKFWDCSTKLIPADAAQTSVYGQNQELVSYGFINSLVIYQIRKGYLDYILNNQTWYARSFNFTAGQLFDVFPLLAERYKPEDDVTGQCQAIQTEVEVYLRNIKSFGIQVGYSCSLFVQRSRFSNLKLKVQYEFQGWIWSQYIRLSVSGYSFDAKFYPYADYAIENLTKAEAIVKDCLRRAYSLEIFSYQFSKSKGSPDYVMEKDFIRFYDKNYIVQKTEKIEITKSNILKETLRDNIKKMLTLDQ